MKKTIILIGFFIANSILLKAATTITQLATPTLTATDFSGTVLNPPLDAVYTFTYSSPGYPDQVFTDVHPFYSFHINDADDHTIAMHVVVGTDPALIRIIDGVLHVTVATIYEDKIMDLCVNNPIEEGTITEDLGLSLPAQYQVPVYNVCALCTYLLSDYLKDPIIINDGEQDYYVFDPIEINFFCAFDPVAYEASPKDYDFCNTELFVQRLKNPSLTENTHIIETTISKLQVYDLLGNNISTITTENLDPNNLETIIKSHLNVQGVFIVQYYENNQLKSKKVNLF